jgi:hypothetical protein
MGDWTNPIMQQINKGAELAIPIVLTERKLQADAQARDKQLEFLREKAAQQTLQSFLSLKAEKDKAAATLLQSSLKDAIASGDQTVYRALAPQLEKAAGVKFPVETLEGGLEQYVMPKAKPTEYDIKDTEQGLMFIPKQPGGGQPIPVGVKGRQQKWEINPPATSGGAAAPAKAPMGYEPNPSGEGLRPIPGGPADKPQRGEQGTKPPKDHVFDAESGTMKLIEGTPTYMKQRGEYSKDTYRVDAITAKLDILEKSAEKLAAHPGINNITGLIGANTWDITDKARNARAQLDSLGSKVATQAISEMREASKTGGALGNTSDADILLLKSSIASLKSAQSKEQMIEALNEIRDVAAASKIRMQRAYETQWGDWESRTSKSPISNKSLDITTLPDDELKRKLGFGK